MSQGVPWSWGSGCQGWDTEGVLHLLFHHADMGSADPALQKASHLGQVQLSQPCLGPAPHDDSYIRGQ